MHRIAYCVTDLIFLVYDHPILQGMADTLSAESRGARILCFDDGGIRCLSSLFILHQLMEKLRERSNIGVAPEPWQHFDLICGTGFGGILALMLGRLRMVGLVI